jgi:anti-sigma factor RsiW
MSRSFMTDPCPQWQDQISAYLDGELPPGEEHAVHAHLRACATCAEALVDLVPLVQALRALPDHKPATDLWPRIAGELRHDPRFFARRLRPRLPRRELGWVAAALLVVVGAATTLQRQAPPEPPAVADVDTYWHQHAIFSHDQGVPGLYAPALHVVQTGYDLDQ